MLYPFLLQPFISRQNPILFLLEASSCNTLSKIMQAHSLLLTSGFSLHPFPPSKLLQLLLSLPSSPPLLSYAQRLFHHSPSPPLFSYNSLIKAHSNAFSLHLFRSLLRDPLAPLPNQYTLTFVLAACRPDSGLELGEAEQVRVHAVRRGFETNLFVSNVLIKLYGSWGLAGDAEKVFCECSNRDLFSWNSMIGVYVGSGDVMAARKVFDEMPDRDVVSWSSVIAGYVQTGWFLEAMQLFQKMQLAGVGPNEFTLSTILASCANLVALDQGRWIHAFINKSRLAVNERLLASLIDMYAKCGEIDFALDLFNTADSPKQTVRPWNAILTGLAIHGYSAEATQLFQRMDQSDVVPDKVTFVSLLTACSHGRFVEKGKLYFDMMRRRYTIEPELEHYGCMVDLLGRAGLLQEAEDIISNMPMIPDAATWGSLLSACRIHKDMERGEKIGKLIKELEPKHVGCHVLLANIYSGYGRWNDAKDVRKKIEMAGERKIPGCSSIEVDGMFHQFLVGDRSHPQTQSLYSYLDEMAVKLKISGYVPEVGEVLLDVDVEDKETALSRHSEKLAVAFGLLNTGAGMPIRIVKNLRVCVDCHHAMKLISKVYKREIIVRDRIRFHRFKDGSCSCGDYW
ncbi:pentatricopeptide repeat-containing protein At3g62890-like [Phalaenopsis equestris]|uniref:pentatricopeptide repeat-containing protein At3g62890-like n=1 Tax=Phalaenopsis equestris TaxID=78828 RepID=UPI0009E58AF6|nr:pentatricopeptide repeat-containing protein At3g62890-like [Phalaenopsis equestris]